jgi:hypothetical protein
MPQPIDILIDRDTVWGDVASGPPEDWDGVIPYAVRVGVLTIMGMEIQCAVLNDGRRVISGDAVEEMIECLREMADKREGHE